jgi:hypothetical protein
MTRAAAKQVRGTQTVERYIERLEKLYDDAEHWLRDAELSSERRLVAIDETVVGRYQAPQLRIRTAAGRKLAELEPVGAQVVGALGRVDLRGRFDSVPILYLLKGGPSVRTAVSGSGTPTEERVTPLFRGVTRDGWYIVELEHPGLARPVDSDCFLDLIRRVADDVG